MWLVPDPSGDEECCRDDGDEEAWAPHATAIPCAPGGIKEQVTEAQREGCNQDWSVVLPPVAYTERDPDDEWCIPDDTAPCRKEEAGESGEEWCVECGGFGAVAGGKECPEAKDVVAAPEQHPGDNTKQSTHDDADAQGSAPQCHSGENGDCHDCGDAGRQQQPRTASSQPDGTVGGRFAGSTGKAGGDEEHRQRFGEKRPGVRPQTCASGGTDEGSDVGAATQCGAVEEHREADDGSCGDGCVDEADKESEQVGVGEAGWIVEEAGGDARGDDKE
ncbi:MAG: hypothetical protein RLY87_823 [Chloroflexota bacterium]